MQRVTRSKTRKRRKRAKSMVTSRRGEVVQAVAVTVIALEDQGKDITGRDISWGTPLGVAVCLGHHIVRKNIIIMVLIPTRRDSFAMQFGFFFIVTAGFK